MGASQYKKKRVEDRESGVVSPAEAAAQEKAVKDRKSRRIYAAIAVALVIMVALVVFVNSSLFSDGLPAVRVGEQEYSVAETRYFYELSYQQFYNSYNSLISYFLNPELPLDEQECSLEPGITWEEYFMNEAVDYLRTITAIYDEAQKAGYTLSEDGYAAIDAEIETMEFYSSIYGYSLDAYIGATYGDGCNEELLRRMMERAHIASEYANVVMDSYTYTEEELMNHYEENHEQYDTVNYHSIFLSGSANEETGLTAEEAMAEAIETAEAIEADCDGSEESFIAAVKKHADQESSAMSTAIASTGNNKEWFTAAEREVGDLRVTESESGVSIYFFLGIDTHDYNTVDVRHLLIQALDSDGSGDYSDEEKQIAKEQLETVMKEWDGTEEGFIALVEEYSQDPGTNGDGGLYETVFKGQMVPEFDAFCFSGAKSGDTAIVYGESDSYCGYHFIYFVGENMPYNQAVADSALRSDAYTQWEDSVVDPVTAEKTFMFRYV